MVYNIPGVKKTALHLRKVLHGQEHLIYGEKCRSIFTF
jgi:hypothetical protein